MNIAVEGELSRCHSSAEQPDSSFHAESVRASVSACASGPGVTGPVGRAARQCAGGVRSHEGFWGKEHSDFHVAELHPPGLKLVSEAQRAPCVGPTVHEAGRSG